MKKFIYSAYLAWVVVCVTLKIIGAISWCAALSPLWFPVLAALSCIIVLFTAAVIVTWHEKRKESKIPDSCANCLFGQTAKYSEDGKCLGEALDESITRGTVCKMYKRN